MGRCYFVYTKAFVNKSINTVECQRGHNFKMQQNHTIDSTKE